MVKQSSRGPIIDDSYEDQDEYEYVEVEEGGGGCSGCGWGVAGLAGCMLLPVAGLLFFVVIGFGAVSNLFYDLSCAFSPDTDRCVASDTPRSILISVRELSVLLTIERTYDTTITTRVDMPYVLRGLYGDALTLNVVQQITAGIDLSQLTEEDVTVDGTSVVIRLPPPQLQGCALLEAQTDVVDRDRGLFTRGITELDTVARQDAIDDLRRRALTSGILEEANTHSIAALTAVYDPIPLQGIESIEIITSDPPSGDDLVIPESCFGRQR